MNELTNAVILNKKKTRSSIFPGIVIFTAATVRVTITGHQGFTDNGTQGSMALKRTKKLA